MPHRARAVVPRAPKAGRTDGGIDLLQEAVLEGHRTAARHFVGTLDASERRILACLVGGMSAKAIAESLGEAPGDVERARAALMKKLGASRTADAVRIGLYAGIEPPD